MIQPVIMFGQSCWKHVDFFGNDLSPHSPAPSWPYSPPLEDTVYVRLKTRCLPHVWMSDGKARK